MVAVSAALPAAPLAAPLAIALVTPLSALFTLLGVLLTVLTLTLLGLGGYLGALLALPSAAPRRTAGDSTTGSARWPDPLLLAVTTLLLALVQAVAIGLLLGSLGVLRLPYALALQLLLVVLMLRPARERMGGDLGGPVKRLGRRTWARLAAHPVLALLVAHAAGSEILRGLLRPPLSWDSLMYHLFLAGTWLQQGSFDIVASRHPTTFYQFMPGDGSLWLWWWMAPSHSELWVNLAAVPHWLLLGLAVGAFARRLGARRHWPLASFLVLLLPTVVRFVATQYVDILVGAVVVAGALFASRWLETRRTADALLLGCCLGLAAGSKALGIPYAGALGGVTALLALLPVPGGASPEGRSGRQLGRGFLQLAAAALVMALLGGVFYVRNLGYGGGPFGYLCAKQEATPAGGALNLPAKDSPLDLGWQLVESGHLVDAFLGVTRPTMTELGVGPQVVLLLALALAVPLLLWRSAPFRGHPWRRRAGALAWSQVAAQVLVWLTFTFAANAHIFANVRYLIGAFGLLFALGLAWLEGRVASGRLQERWLQLLALVLAIQSLLMLNAQMPRGVRLAFALALGLAALLALAAPVRRLVRTRWPVLAGAAALLLLLASVPLAEFRRADRGRAYGQEYTAHLSSSRLFAKGWGWLDANAGDAAVAVSHAPENFFVYPAMGQNLERRAVYVHINEANHTNPLLYESCKTRVDPDPDAWLRNLEAEEVRFLHLARYPEFDFPVEDQWASARPDLFRLRYEDNTNRIYEVGQ